MVTGPFPSPFPDGAPRAAGVPGVPGVAAAPQTTGVPEPLGVPATAADPDALRREVDLRLQAVTRMRHMNAQHAMHAWNRRYDDPIAPYGLAFLYVRPLVPGKKYNDLVAATKLWLAGPEAENLPRMLFDLNGLVIQRFGDEGAVDLRQAFANRSDPDMTDDSWYVGLGVSSLDTHTGDWAQACRTVSRYGDVPGAVRIVMIDGTVITCDRRGLAEFNALTLRSTTPLGASTLDSLYPWSPIGVEDVRRDPFHADVLRWMEELHINLWRLDMARLDRRRQGGRDDR